MRTAINGLSLIVQQQGPAGDFRMFRIKFRFIQTVTDAGTAGRRGGRRPYGLRIQVQDDPAQLTGVQHIIGPDNRRDGFTPPANTVDLRLSHVGIVPGWSIDRIVEPRNREPHNHSQADTKAWYWLLQDDKAT